MRVNKKKGQDLAVTRLGGIRESERGDAVLKDLS